jgi:hypothetical protein
MSIILDGTNGETFPSWTTAGRPSPAATGQTGFNSTLGYLESYNGTTWVAGGLPAPSTSGNVLTSDGTNWVSSAGSIGVGQVYSLPTRSSGTTYTNSGAKPIFVSVVFSYNTTSSGSPSATVVVGGITILSSTFSITTSGGNLPFAFSFIVPVGASYVCTVTGNTTISRWAELS